MSQRLSTYLTLALGAALLSTGCGAQSYRAAAQQHDFQAQRLAQRGQIEASLQEVDRAVAAYPTEPSLLVMRAQLLQLAEQLAESERDIDRALRLAPDRPDVVMAAAMQRASQGETDEALELVQRALVRSPGSEPLLWLAGSFHLMRDEAAIAETRFTALLERAEIRGSPFLVRGRVGLALAESMQSPGAGTAELAEAARVDSNTTLQTCDSFEQAGLGRPLRELAAAASRAYPDDYAIGIINASLLHLSGFSDQALAECERLLALEPDRTMAVNLLLLAASADAECFRYAGAREKVRSALDLEPTHMIALEALVGSVIKGRGNASDFEDARERVARAQEMVEDRADQAFLGRLMESLVDAE